MNELDIKPANIYRAVTGQICPVVTREQAEAAGLQELTLPIRLDGEAGTLAEIAANFASGGIRWALVMCKDDKGFESAAVWRENIRSCDDVDQDRARSGCRIRPLDGWEPRAAALA